VDENINIDYIPEKAWKIKENPASVKLKENLPKENLEIGPPPYQPISRLEYFRVQRKNLINFPRALDGWKGIGRNSQG